jgi:RHS repeat-associated protein
MITFTPITMAGGNKGNYYCGARYYDPKISVWLSVDPKAHWYPRHSPYNFSLNNPINLVDPNGQWVEGAGFFNNLFNSDRYVLAKEAAAKHTNSTITKRENGSYRVSYTTKSNNNESGGEHMHMDDLHMEEFQKGGNKNRTDKTFMHTTDRQFKGSLKKAFGASSSIGAVNESLDRNFAKPFAKFIGELNASWNPIVAIPNSIKIMHSGVSIFGDEKVGTFDRYVAPGVSVLAPMTGILGKSKDAADLIPNSVDIWGSVEAGVDFISEILNNSED